MIEVRRFEPTKEALQVYACISSRFEVSTRYDVPAMLEGRFVPLATPMQIKENEDPLTWGTYDLTRWGLFIAFDDETLVGACALARGVDSLYFDAAPNEAVVWDIRVDPMYRGQSIAKTLLQAAKSWAREEGIGALLIETQDTNVAACALYASAGAMIHETRPGAYIEYPDEVLIVWRIDLR